LLCVVYIKLDADADVYNTDETKKNEY